MSFGNMGNMNKMMKQVQKMQKDMAKLQEELEARTVEATAGGGAVKVVCSGKQEIHSIEISPDVVDAEDIDMLQDLVMAAINESLRLSKDMVSNEMAKLTGGLNLPGMPF